MNKWMMIGISAVVYSVCITVVYLARKKEIDDVNRAIRDIGGLPVVVNDRVQVVLGGK